MRKKTLPPRGMKDILPIKSQQREKVIQTLIRVYSKWGFSSIECPAMENIEHLIGSGGGDNEKLVFQVLRRGLNEHDYKSSYINPRKIVDMGLRFDLTVPLARFYASNQTLLPKVSKFIQYGPVWRAERPQKGRFRQFMQWDADIVGEKEGFPETELLLCGAEALLALGLKGFVVRFNDRRVLKAIVNSVGISEIQQNETFIVIDKLDKIGIDGVEKELIGRGFDFESTQKLANKLSSVIISKPDSIENGLKQLEIEIDPKVAMSMKDVFNQIKTHYSDFSIIFDPTLVRGMGYYTGQIFEIEYGDYPFSIAGGGRYDGMIGRFLGREIPACGFSLGFDRILAILNEEGLFLSKCRSNKLVLFLSKNDIAEALAYANELRAKGWEVNSIIKEKNLKKQINEYKAIGFSSFCIYSKLGEMEIKDIG